MINEVHAGAGKILTFCCSIQMPIGAGDGKWPKDKS